MSESLVLSATDSSGTLLSLCAIVFAQVLLRPIREAACHTDSLVHAAVSGTCYLA